MNDMQLVHLYLQTLPVALFDLLGAAALGSVIIAFACEVAAKAKRTAFLDKFAQQLAGMALWTLLLSTGAGVAAFFIGASKVEGLEQWALSGTSPALPLFASLGFTIFSLSLYRANWRNLRQSKGPHLVLGMFAALGSALSIYTCVAALSGLSGRFLADTPLATDLLSACFPPMGAPFWPVALGAFFLCLCYGGALGAAYLVHRRNRDDFGRDYYNFALPLAARWALVPLLGVLGAGLWLAQLISMEVGMLLLKHPLVCFGGSAAAAVLVAVLCWLVLALSKRPLRMKGMAVLAVLIAWGVHAVLLFGALVIYPLT